MIVRNGLGISIPVLFENGVPDGDVSWSLLDTAGNLLTSGTVVVPVGAASIVIPVDAAHNTLDVGALSATRDLDWSYVLSGVIINGNFRYSIEARAPFGATCDGVRQKLGVGVEEVPDSDISLIDAYRYLRTTAGAAAVAAVSDNGGDNDAILRRAIEAFAALVLLPTMPVRVAAQEESGTNMYKRQTIDWSALEGPLSTMVDEGILLADPSYDPMSDSAALFVVATPALDPITGDAYSA